MAVTLLGGLRLAVPTDIAGCTAWFAAGEEVFSDAGVTPAVDTNALYRWGNKVDASYFEQSVAGNRPTYRTGIVNGQPVVRFGGATDDDYMDGSVAWSSWLAVGAKTIFVVYNHTAAATTQLLGDSGGRIAMFLVNTGADLNCANDDGAVDTATNTAQSTGTWTIGTLLHSGGTLYAGVNDTRTASMISVASGNTASLAGTPMLGATAGPANFLDGDIAEVVIFNTAVAEEDRKAVERFLASKFGIVLGY